MLQRKISRYTFHVCLQCCAIAKTKIRTPCTTVWHCTTRLVCIKRWILLQMRFVIIIIIIIRLSRSCASCGRTGWMTALQSVYRSVVVARLFHAASAWRGLTKASYRRRINVLLDRAKRQEYFPSNLPTFDELCEKSDGQLFNNILSEPMRMYHTVQFSTFTFDFFTAQESQTPTAHTGTPERNAITWCARCFKTWINIIGYSRGTRNFYWGGCCIPRWRNLQIWF